MKNHLRLMLSNGTESSLEEIYPGERILLYFYPKDMTSGCTKQAELFRDHYAFFQDQGIQILGVSRDPIEKHQQFIEKYTLPYLLISDESAQLCEGFNVWVEKSMYGRKYMGIERSTFLLDGDNREIQETWSKVKPASHIHDLIEYFS